MAFTYPQALTAMKPLFRALKASGLSDLKSIGGKPDVWAIFNGMKANLDSTTYKTAQNDAIEAVLPGNTLTTEQKRLIHEAVMRAMINEGLS